MRITVKRAGGYAGSEEYGEVDTDALGTAGAQLEALVRRARGLAPATATADVIGADIPRSTITISDGGKQQSRTFVEDGRPETADLTAIINTVLRR